MQQVKKISKSFARCYFCKKNMTTVKVLARSLNRYVPACKKCWRLKVREK